MLGGVFYGKKPLVFVAHLHRFKLSRELILLRFIEERAEPPRETKLLAGLGSRGN